MLETNIRIVRPGSNLYVLTRQANLSGPNLTADLVEKACGALRYRHSVAAVPCPGKSGTLLVASQQPVQPIHLEGDEWEIDVTDAGQPTHRLTLADQDGAILLPNLIERAFLARIAALTDFWTLDSPRIWYEPGLMKKGSDALW